MITVISGIYFFVLLFLFMYLPGRFLLRVAKYEEKEFLIRFPLEIGIGIALFISAEYLLSWIHLEILYVLLLLPVIAYELKQMRGRYKHVTFRFPLFEASLLFIGSIIALYVTGGSGREVNGEMVFYGVNATDAIFHLSLIGNLTHQFPPTHAGLSGISLHGYNFLYDFLVASFAKFFFLNPFDLFFRFFSLFVSLFYGLSCLAVARFLKMDTITSRFFIFLAFFAQGTLFIFRFLNITYDPGIVQPLGNIVDPSVLFSISLFLLSFILFFSMNKVLHSVLGAVVIAVIPMIKIYTAFLLFGALGIAVILAFLLDSKKKWLYANMLVLGGILGGILYAPINLGVGKLIFAPFLFYTHFLESYAAANHSDWWLRLLVYFEHKNYLRIIQNYLLLLLLFFIPSLSLRLLGIVNVKKMFSRDFYSEKNIFWISTISLGIIIPSFFIQNIAVFVIIQFLWVTYFILLIPTAFGLGALYNYFSSLGRVILIISIICISIPDTYSLLKLYSSNPFIIPRSTVQIAKDIKNIIPSNESMVVVNAFKDGDRIQNNYTIPLMSALSSHDVYYEPEVLEFSNIDTIVTKRVELIAGINTTLHSCNDKSIANKSLTSLMKNTNSIYLVILKKERCLSTLPSFTLVSQKGEAALYKLR